MKGEDLFNARVFQSAETTTTFYQFIATLRQKIKDEVKQTSPTHKFIRTLRDGGRLMRCYTQNIDGLEAREGMCMDLSRGRGNKRRFMKKNYEAPRPQVTQNTDFDAGCEVVQLHGDLTNLRCRVCAAETKWSDDATEIYLDRAAPTCEICAAKSNLRQATGKRGLAVGELRPNIVLYGEDHPQNALLTPIIAFDQACNPDLLIVMGTSLKVHGLQKVVREFAKIVHSQKNGRVIFVNRTRPSESLWDGVIDDYIAMDCDDWIIDLKERREDLWHRQGELDLKVTKVVGQKRKRNLEANEKENVNPAKRSKVTVNVPPLKKSKSKRDSQTVVVDKTCSAKAQTPRARAQTGWRNRTSGGWETSKLLSPLVRQRPACSPLKNHFKPLGEDQEGNLFVPGSPLSPAISTLTTPATRTSRHAENDLREMTTPTPRQNMRASARSKLGLSIFQDSENALSPTVADGIEVQNDNEEDNPQPLTSSPIKQLSFVNANTDDEEVRPLASNSSTSRGLLQRLFRSATSLSG